MAEEKNTGLDMALAEEKVPAAVEIGTGLSELEFRFLCASYGITSLVGFEIPATEETQEQQMQGLLNMVKRGLLKQEDDRFVVCEETAEMMECIATRITTMRIWSPESSVPNCVIYTGENKAAVMACPGKKKGEYAVLTYLPAGTLSGFLASSDLIPNAMVPEEIAEAGREINKDGIQIPEGATEGSNNIRLEILFYEGTDAEDSTKLSVIWMDVQELVVVDTGDVKTADLYVTREIIPIICTLCGAEET